MTGQIALPDELRHPGIYVSGAEIFLILPHPLGYMRKKTENYDRWISGMAKIQAKMRESYGK